MNWLWNKITGGLTQVKDFLLAYGPFGLFAIALLDSALIPLPAGPDVVMILLTIQRPAWMPIYAAAATLGSVAGCVILYYISRRAGSRALSRFSEAKQARVKRLIDRYDVLSVLIASILPPPFPFKMFVITSGVFRLNVVRFAIAIGVGRALRFLLEGYLAVHYGDQADEVFKQYFPWIGGALALVIILIVVGRMLWRKKRKGTAQEDFSIDTEEGSETEAKS
ncbi:MAG TPA: VTT domain-containing protein [Pyrinomonadaceae bacterium]|nr:VTT domain-containing protein [Pyrinomonadaceae bacterium]